ncbi:MAG: hypothetical protein KC486_34225 [Myxococcales bacterium]|nr:hypothetical protein [Myxococcales bacterium]
MLTSLIRWGYPPKSRTAPQAWGDPDFDTSWTMEAIDAPGAWLVPAAARCDAAVIDTGVYADHDDMKGVRRVAGTAWTDADGHGTAVAGILAASHAAGLGLAGVCPDVGLASFRADESVLDFSVPALGYTPRLTRLLAALAELHGVMTSAHTHALRVVAIAKAGAAADVAAAEELCRERFLKPIGELLADGLVVVLGGANDAVPTAQCVPAATRALLARPPGLIVVAGSEPPWGGPWERNATMTYRRQGDADLWAPGGLQTTLRIDHPAAYNEIVRTGGGDMPFNSGNSLAIPHVAGVAAWIARVDPTLSADDIGRLLRETAEVQVNAGASPIRALNAFAAALVAHNRARPTARLAGYRVMIPHRIDLATGAEELEGAVLVLAAPGHSDRVRIPFAYIPKIGSEYAFCRFTAPAELPIHAELHYRRRRPGGGEETLCLWRGALTQLVRDAPAGAANSAWTHPACPELYTLRLQGLALALVHDGDPGRPVARAMLRLRHAVSGREHDCVTALDGTFIAPFIEPGPYELIGDGIDGLAGELRIAMDLDLGTIYAVDPATRTRPFISTSRARPSPWIERWAGEVELVGSACAGEYDQVSGPLSFTTRSKPLRREHVLDLAIAAISDEHPTYADFVADYGELSAAELPDFDRRSTRVCSAALARLRGSPSDEQEESMSAVRDGVAVDWSEVTPPPGFILGEGGESLTVAVDVRALSVQALAAHFERPDEQAFPFEIDLSFSWWLGYANHPAGDETTRYELLLASAERILVPAALPWTLERVDGWPQRWRLIVGPASGAIELRTAPGSSLRLSEDPEPVPAGYTSARVEERDEPTSERAANVYAIGPAGEVAVISRWRHRTQPYAPASHVFLRD